MINCVEKYEEIVLANFKKEYVDGRTPNPCVWCNAYIKFGALPEMARAQGIEFDKFATGHYAQVEEQNGHFYLKRGIAPKKDQSYFLYRLKQEQLQNIILPLGKFSKEEIREIALKHGLLSAEKPDSQDFYGGDYNELLGLEENIGNIVDTQGNILGTHKGIWNYTVGQRKGIGIAAKEALYVLRLDKDKNEVVVGFADETFKKQLVANNVNFIIPVKIGKEISAGVKIRSTQQPQDAKIIRNEGDTVTVTFDEYQKSIALGQSAVFYDGDRVIGGGIIDEIRS